MSGFRQFNRWTTHKLLLVPLKRYYTNSITNNIARKSVPVDAQNLDFVTLFIEGIHVLGKKGLQEVFPKLFASWFLKLTNLKIRLL